MTKLHDRMFIAQSTLEAWVDSSNVEVRENFVHLKRFRRAYQLEPAVRIKLATPAEAGASLIGKVLTERRIIDAGGELLGDSVIIGEAAYVVEPGYVGTLLSESEARPIEEGSRKGKR